MMKKYMVLLTVCLGTVLSSYVSSCVNIALPNLMQALNFNMDSVVWVSLSYMLPYGSTLPLTGKLGDQYGAKKMYLLGLVIFSISSLLCGLAGSATVMIVLRVLQGVGAGMLLPNAMAIVAAVFAPHERGQALGIWSAMAAAGSALGPTMGGFLIEHFNWRYIFFSVIPFCLAAIALAYGLIPQTKNSRKTEVDYIGAATLIIAISSLLLALNQGQKEGWDSLYIVSLFYTAFAASVLFIGVELKVEHPMIDVRLFGSTAFTMANIIGFISFSAMYGAMFLLPFFLKSVLHYSAVNAGLMLLPMTATMVLFAPLGGRLADRLGSRLPAVAGTMLIFIALYWLSDINSSYGFHQFFTRLVLLGVGMGFTMSPLSNCAIGALPKDKIGVGSGVFNLAKIIGGSIGVVFVETLLTNREAYHQQVLAEELNAAAGAPETILSLLRAVWGDKGMDQAMLTEAMHGWVTGHGFLPAQYLQFKTLLQTMLSQQASILSFQDVFFCTALVCLGGVICSFFLRERSRMSEA